MQVAVLGDQECGEQLLGTGHGAAFVGVDLVQHLAGVGIHNDRGGTADFGDTVELRVERKGLRSRGPFHCGGRGRGRGPFRRLLRGRKGGGRAETERKQEAEEDGKALHGARIKRMRTGFASGDAERGNDE